MGLGFDRALGVAALSQACASGGQFAVTLVLVRWLGLAEFGVLALVLLVATFAAGLVQALAAQPFASVGGGERSSAPAWAAASVALAVALFAGLLALGVTLAFFGPELARLAPAVGALVASRALHPMARTLSFVGGRHARTLAVDVLGPWGGSAAVAAFAWAGADPLAAALLGLGAGSAAAACVGLASLGVSVRPSARAVRAEAGRAWSVGRWLALNQVASWFGTGSVHVAAAATLGPAAVGALRAAQALAGVLTVALQALDLALPRRAAAALARGELVRWTETQTRRVVAAMACGALLLVACAGPAVALVTRDPSDAAGARAALVILAFVPVAGGLAGILTLALRAVERTDLVFRAYAAAALAGAAAAAPLVAAFGIEGAALCLLGAQALNAGLLVLGWRGLWTGRRSLEPPVGAVPERFAASACDS